MIAIIPARGGSKRIKRKNIRNFHGKPIILYTIDAAKKSNCFSRVIVSTEDEEIARVVSEAGVEVFNRPKELADDYSTTKDVIRNVITSLSLKSPVCTLSAVSPFMTPKIITDVCGLLNEDDFVFDCMEFSVPAPIQRSFEIKNGKSKMILPKHMNTRSQDLLPCYYHTGQICLGTVDTWMKEINTLDGTPFIVEKAVDIDTEEDWQRALMLYDKKVDLALPDYLDTKMF